MPAISSSRILIVATDRFEESELFGPKRILEANGAKVLVASLNTTPIQATVHDDPGRTIRPDLTIAEAKMEDFDALVLPGGLGSPDRLRTEVTVIALIRAFNSAAKPIASICHGPWLLVEADVLRERRATSWPSIRTDLVNAGATWLDEPAVTDGHILTSRKPADVPEFTGALIALVEQAPAGR